MTKPVPVDAFTYTRVSAVLAAARQQGLDPIEHLNRVGLLLTPAQEKRIRLEAMNFVMEQLESWRPAEFLRRRYRNLNVTTQDDLYRCIREWLADHITVVREGM